MSVGECVYPKFAVKNHDGPSVVGSSCYLEYYSDVCSGRGIDSSGSCGGWVHHGPVGILSAVESSDAK